MTAIRDVLAHDPSESHLPNEGVAKLQVLREPEDSGWDVLRWELQRFVCDGEYRRGLESVLATYLSRLTQPQQPAVWVSGFYGSGKSHFLRVLDAIWRDVEFPDGARARGLVTLTDDIEAHVRELTTVGKREGGLWAAAGALDALPAGSSVRLATLNVVFQAADLPAEYPAARFVIWLKQEGNYDAVRAAVEVRGKEWKRILNDMYVAPALAEALLEVVPTFAPTAAEAHTLLYNQFPKVDEITTEEFISVLESVFALVSTTVGKWPCTLIVLDELQQFLGGDVNRTLEVQQIVEACSARFGSRVLFVAAGQNAMGATPELGKLQDRFSVRVTLKDSDVDKVVRDVVLRKKPGTEVELRTVLDRVSGEISRHLGGTKIEARAADEADLVPEYPLLPTRRRFWEAVLRSTDTGKAAQLRTQLRIVHDATKDIADKPLGWVVPADVIYDELEGELQMTAVLPRNTAVKIGEYRQDGTEPGKLKARLCALVFLIGKLDPKGPGATGLTATVDTLADLLVEDLNQGSAALRQDLPQLLEQLGDDGMLNKIEGAYQIETPEAAEWERERRRHAVSIASDPTRLSDERSAELRAALRSVGEVALAHGASKVKRKVALFFDENAPPAQPDNVPVWIRHGWSVSEKAVQGEARAAGTNSPTVFVFLPKREQDALNKAIADFNGAVQTIDGRPMPSTDEGRDARSAMISRRDSERARLDGFIKSVLDGARVFQGGGNEVVGLTVQDAVKQASEASLTRLYPDFGLADMKGWGEVVKKAREGAPDALRQVAHNGDANTHAACKTVLEFIGPAGKKGSEAQKRFQAPPYGWEKDAVDGSLLALAAGGFLRTTQNGQAVTLRQIPQNQLGSVDYFTEGVIIPAPIRIAMRGLLQQLLGEAPKAGEESAAVVPALRRLREIASRAGGAAPLAAAPSVQHIDNLLALAGNEQFMKVHDARDQLLSDLSQWTEAEKLIEQRSPRWTEAERLLAHASQLPEFAQLSAQIEGIKADRTLLSTPDPLAPVTQQLCDVLRGAVTGQSKKLEDERVRLVATLVQDQGWVKLDDSQRSTISSQQGLLAEAEPQTGDVGVLLRSLDAAPLKDWEAKLIALPQRVVRAREAAAKLLEPKAIRIEVPHTTLRNEDDVDPYLAKVREAIMAHIKDNPVII